LLTHLDKRDVGPGKGAARLQEPAKKEGSAGILDARATESVIETKQKKEDYDAFKGWKRAARNASLWDRSLSRKSDNHKVRLAMSAIQTKNKCWVP